ncbi:Hypothetical protein NTJ_03971 [Nesidiocoris tenuis]|uniref:Uncharacterized protein n=1 Tax=Nesidiocoris tenuis TaxID=355587 RepID=A0ABN7ALC9_9HEMI|nr:Hypothetical protein NTJ_03971 [Nesidiocoris tenuis]
MDIGLMQVDWLMERERVDCDGVVYGDGREGWMGWRVRGSTGREAESGRYRQWLRQSFFGWRQLEKDKVSSCWSGWLTIRSRTRHDVRVSPRLDFHHFLPPSTDCQRQV